MNTVTWGHSGAGGRRGLDGCPAPRVLQGHRCCVCGLTPWRLGAPTLPVLAVTAAPQPDPRPLSAALPHGSGRGCHGGPAKHQALAAQPWLCIASPRCIPGRSLGHRVTPLCRTRGRDGVPVGTAVPGSGMSRSIPGIGGWTWPLGRPSVGSRGSGACVGAWRNRRGCPSVPGWTGRAAAVPRCSGRLRGRDSARAPGRPWSPRFWWTPFPNGRGERASEQSCVPGGSGTSPGVGAGSAAPATSALCCRASSRPRMASTSRLPGGRPTGRAFPSGSSPRFGGRVPVGSPRAGSAPRLQRLAGLRTSG